MKQLSLSDAYVVDLDEDPDQRWAHVIHREHRAAGLLAKEAMVSLQSIPNIARPLLVGGFAALYKLHGGRHVEEIETWAKAMGVTNAEAVTLQCTYELSHMACTAGARWVTGLGMVHTRNMDWELDEIANSTRIFEYAKGGRRFYVVGILGLVGVLSGMVPKGYSVTINWAPTVTRPGFDWGPLFLLRHTLEECDTFDEAVFMLSRTPLSTNVFFTVCGTKKGQACVIERTRTDYLIRRMLQKPTLAQANHYNSRKFKGLNVAMDFEIDDETGETFLDDSMARQQCMAEELSCYTGRHTLDEVAQCLDIDPVFNSGSHQQMVFCPRTGEMLVWCG